MKLLASIVFSVSVIFAITEQAAAHSGGTDRYGCHGGSRPYHCHGGGGDVHNDALVVIVVLGGIAVTIWGIYVIASFSSDNMAALDKMSSDVHLPEITQSKQFYLSSVVGKNWGLGVSMSL